MDATTETPAVEVMPPARPWEALPEGTYAIVELMGHTTLVGRVIEDGTCPTPDACRRSGDCGMPF